MKLFLTVHWRKVWDLARLGGFFRDPLFVNQVLVDHYFNNTYSPTYPQGLPTFLTIAADSPSWGLVGLGLWKAQISSNSLASGEGIRSGYGGKEGRNPRTWFLLEGANLTCTYSVPLLQSSLLPFKPILGIEFRSPGFCAKCWAISQVLFFLFWQSVTV